MTEAFPQFEFTEVPRKKRRWVAPVSVLATLLVLLLVAFFVLDGLARGFAGNLIETKARSALSLPASTPVDVTVGGTSVLFQLLSQKLDRVDVAVKGLNVGDLSGDATLTVTGVPTVDQSKPIDTARLVFDAGQDDLQKMLAGLSGLPGATVTIVNGTVQLSTTFTVFGVSLPVAVTVVPSAVGGQLVLTPKSVQVNGATITPEALRTTLGDAGAALLAPQTICVAGFLPKAMTLDSLRVKGSDLVVAVTGKSVVLNSALLTAKGTCPAA